MENFVIHTTDIDPVPEVPAASDISENTEPSFTYTKEEANRLQRLFGQLTQYPDLNFSWADAARMSREVARKITATLPEGEL